MEFGIVVFIVVLVVFWLISGFINRRDFEVTMKGFKLDYSRYEHVEKTSQNMAAKAQAYLQKNQLIEKYPLLYEQLVKKEKGEPTFGLGYFLLLGPLFYLK